MACVGVKCVVANATCAETDGGYTCRCNDGFTGHGFTKCTVRSSLILEDDYIYIAVAIVLLFVGLVVILIFFLCRRRILDKSQEEPLVTSVEDQYDMKWQMVLSGNDVPPPYTEEKKEDQLKMTTFFTDPVEPARVEEEERVTVEPDEEDYRDEVDVAKDYDNPAYDTVVKKSDDISAASTPEEEEEEECKTEDADDFERAVIGKVYENPSFEKDEPEAESVLEEDSPEIDPVPEVEKVDEIDEPIKITFEEKEANTVTANITTPNANLTINLNINIPETATPEE